MPKAPPKFVTNIGAWEYTLAKLEDKGKLTENGDPQNYAAASAIYKNVCKKYAAFGFPNVDLPQLKNEHNNVGDLDDKYPVGSEFFCDDMIVRAQEAQEGSGIAVYPDSDGNLLIQVRILDVDPAGRNRNKIDYVIGVDPNRCCLMTEVV